MTLSEDIFHFINISLVFLFNTRVFWGIPTILWRNHYLLLQSFCCFLCRATRNFLGDLKSAWKNSSLWCYRSCLLRVKLHQPEITALSGDPPHEDLLPHSINAISSSRRFYRLKRLKSWKTKKAEIVQLPGERSMTEMDATTGTIKL